MCCVRVLHFKHTALHGCAQPSKAVCTSRQGGEMFCLHENGQDPEMQNH
ncbi:unnamed protein product, partial [Staurois parvus]